MSRIFLLAAALAVSGLPATAHAEKLSGYAVQTSGDYTTRGGNEIYGKVAVGGNITANADRFGTHLTAADNGSPGVVVLGDINYANSQLLHGDVVYGGSNLSPLYHPIATPNGATYQATPLVFDAMSTAAATVSALFGGMNTTGSYSDLWGVGTLTATAPGLNIFQLDAGQFDSLHQLNLVGAPGAVAVINIFGSVSDHLTFNIGNFTPDSVLFNFVDATRVQSNGIAWQGAILAPNALVSLEGGSVLGSVVSKHFDAAGATVRGDSFAYIPTTTAVPEPASWAMLILGFGAIGLLARRRRYRGRPAVN
ncbi:choice-of-anchor A family protein [Sphingomonas flavalba]|uniref:choice-of-anchor A family protein n=1 Tax=Sphingomonas flavalba TaxID=2559804 RepID=UPI0039E0904F